MRSASVHAALCETQVEFDKLMRISRDNYYFLANLQSEPLERNQSIYIVSEPNWKETLVQVNDLKYWLKGRGVFPPFFFPEGKADGFRDRGHARYSAKLACAVAAWEAVKKPASNKSAKETVTQWVQSNGASFGMADDNGIVPNKAVEEVAKVVNWATKGGAAPTYQGEAEKEPEPIQNYRHVDDFDKENLNRPRHAMPGSNKN